MKQKYYTFPIETTQAKLLFYLEFSVEEITR